MKKHFTGKTEYKPAAAIEQALIEGHKKVILKDRQKNCNDSAQERAQRRLPLGAFLAVKLIHE